MTWPAQSGELERGMAFPGKVEKGNSLQQLSSSPPSPLLPRQES